MADKLNRLPFNVPGPYYVDDTCVDCGLCRELAPHLFALDECFGYSYVQHQPETPPDTALAEEALTSCPTESIGNDG